MARHPRPLREDLADSYVYVPIEPESGFEKEQLFAQQIQERVFRICCVPFFAYGLALGDLVSTDDGHVFISRLRASGRRLVRLYFHDESQIESVLGEVQQMGCAVEVSPVAHIFALDFDHAVQPGLNAYLLEKHRIGTLDFEWGYQQED